MTIQELGSIGELVGAVATVATLLYLAIQIRQNTNSVLGVVLASVCQDQILEGIVRVARPGNEMIDF